MLIWMLVRTAGIEPARPCGQKILSLQRLPFRHVRIASDHALAAEMFKRLGLARRAAMAPALPFIRR
jgi:hypothetical protein